MRNAHFYAFKVAFIVVLNVFYIAGSFIHAGHGDINPGQSWGQPQRIDDIYLKNPILRNEDEMRSG